MPKTLKRKQLPKPTNPNPKPSAPAEKGRLWNTRGCLEGGALGTQYGGLHTLNRVPLKVAQLFRGSYRGF